MTANRRATVLCAIVASACFLNSESAAQAGIQDLGNLGTSAALRAEAHAISPDGARHEPDADDELHRRGERDFLLVG